MKSQVHCHLWLLACSLLMAPVFAADLDGRLYDTFYLDGEKQTYVLTIRADGSFEVMGPDGRKGSGRINATKREIGFMGSASRHFAYGFDGANLLLMPTDKDAPAAGDVLGEMPPRRDNETLRWIARATWIKLHPEAVLVPAPAVAGGTGSGAGGGAGLEGLLEVERTRGRQAAQTEAEFRLYMAAGDREYYAGRLAEAKKQYEYAQRFKPEDAETRRRINELNQKLAGGTGGFEIPGVNQNTGTVAGATGASEEQILALVRNGRLDEAQRLAAENFRMNPNSLRASRLSAAADQARAAERTATGVQAALQRAQRAAQEAQGYDANDATARRVSEMAAQQNAVAAQAQAQARDRLQQYDFDGVARAHESARSAARTASAECASAADSYTKRAEEAGEFKGLKIGDLKIFGVDTETKKSRKWSALADTFKGLTKETSDLAP